MLGVYQLLYNPHCREDSVDYKGFTLLHAAVMLKRSADLIEFLVSRGADVNCRSLPYQETPLVLTGMYCPADVHVLLRLGARPDSADWHGSTALSRATEKREAMERMGWDGHPGSTVADYRGAASALEAALEGSADSPQGQSADRLREEGNEAYCAGDNTRAERLYSESLLLREDHRGFSNRAACLLRRAVAVAAAEETEGGPRSEAAWALFKQALSDAGRAAKLSPTNAKAWFRQARAQMGLRDFPRALVAASSGLKHCPEDGRLSALCGALQELRVSDRMTNTFSPYYQAMQREMMAHVMRGGDCVRCAYCCILLMAPMERWGATCPMCQCDPKGGGVVSLGRRLDSLRLDQGRF